MKQSVADATITVLPSPREDKTIGKDESKPPHLILSSCGTITPQYDFELLFKVLEKLDIPWYFIWVGGVGKKEERPFLKQLQNQIKARGWQNRFEITGWVSDSELDTIIEKSDIYLALFKTKSTSASLVKALGFRKKIITTSLPMTQELVAEGPVMSVVAPRTPAIIKEIKKYLADTQDRLTCQQTINEYMKKHSCSVSSQSIFDMTREL